MFASTCELQQINLSKLILAVKNGQLNCYDRFSTFSDLYAMASTSQTFFATNLEFLEIFTGEKEYPVLKEIIKSIIAITKLIWHNDADLNKFFQFKKYFFQ